MKRADVCLLLAFISPSAALGGQAVRAIKLEPELTVPIGANHLWSDWVSPAANGDVVVVQPNTESVRVFGAGGALRATVGAKGDALGSFMRIGDAGWLADTLWIGDRTLNRLTLIAPTLKPLRTIPTGLDAILASGDPAPVPSATGPNQPRVVGLYPGGSLLLYAYIAPRASVPTGWNRLAGSTYAYVQLSSKTGVVEHVAAWVPTVAACNVHPSPEIQLTPPFCPAEVHAESADGRIIAVAVPAVAGPDSGAFRLVLIGTRGDTLVNARFPFTAVPISQQALDSAVARIPGISRSAALTEFFKTYRPGVYPPLMSAVVGRDSSVWIEQRAQGAKRWIVINKRGVQTAAATVPLNVDIKSADATHVWAVSKADDGALSVIRYRIRE